MKIFGKVHWMVLVGGLGILVIVGILLTAGESPQARASAFLSALAEGDAQKLAELSHVPDRSKEEVLAEWEKTVERSRHYQFAWEVKSMVQQADDQAAIRLGWYRNLGPSSYEEKFDLSLRKIDGQWYVIPSSLSRQAYPFLPRF